MRYNPNIILAKATKNVAPLALALAVLTANATCYFFTFQPDVPNELKNIITKHRGKNRNDP